MADECRWDLGDGWCLTHRRHCSMAPTEPPRLLPVPQTVEVDGRQVDVLAAVALPAQRGERPAHAVMYQRSDDLGDFAVGMLIHDGRKSYLADGEYDLDYWEALDALQKRIPVVRR